jgi:hypothetical protein
MDLICYPRMGTPCKRRMLRRYSKGRYGRNKTYRYRPRNILIRRLAQELGWTEAAVREQIYKERLYLLREMYGASEISGGQV